MSCSKSTIIVKQPKPYRFLVTGKVAAGGASNAKDVAYTSETAKAQKLKNVEQALDKVLGKVYYEPLAISGFTTTKTVEVGDTILPGYMTWALNKAPLAQSIQISGSEAKVLQPDVRSYSFGMLKITETKTITLTCRDLKDDGVTPIDRTSKRYYNVLNRIFYNAVTAIPTTSEQVRAMKTGGAETDCWSNKTSITYPFNGKIFTIALPKGKTLKKAVVKETNADVTNQFKEQITTVNVTYKEATTEYTLYNFVLDLEMKATLILTL